MSLRIDATEWISGALLIGDTGLGVLGADIPASGESGPAYAYNDLSLPDDAGKEICGRIVTWPTGGTLYVYEDTSFTFSGPEGSYSFEYQLYVDGVATGGLAVVTLVVGDNAEITLTGSNSIQGNVGSTGTVGGSLNLSGAAASQSNSASGSAITQTHALVGGNSSQANTAGSGSVSQVHVLFGKASTQANLGSTAALGEVTLTLTGAAGSQSNSASTGSITQTHVLMAAPSVQDNIASASAIVQAHLPAASNAVQSNLGSIGAIVIAGVTYWPAPEQVLAGVVYGPTGVEYTGTLVPGTGATVYIEQTLSEIMDDTLVVVLQDEVIQSNILSETT